LGRPSRTSPCFVRGCANTAESKDRIFTLEIRIAEGRLERFPDLASDLVRSKVAVIVAWTTLGVRAAKGPLRNRWIRSYRFAEGVGRIV
jgi:hypothetical protein